jgi:hypothetical protein
LKKEKALPNSFWSSFSDPRSSASIRGSLFSASFLPPAWKGTYLTAVGGGGKGEAANKLPLHTDAKKVGGWEKFLLVPVRKPTKSRAPSKPKK